MRTNGGRSSFGARRVGGPWVAAAIAAATCGCASVEHPTVALYPSPRLPRAEVVHLFGPLQSVDGRDVADLGDGVEVLPGCHVVWTRGDAVESTSMVFISGRPSGRPFAVGTKPGFTYVFKRQVMDTMDSRVRVLTSADELDATGATVRTLQPARSPDELADCRAQAQSP